MKFLLEAPSQEEQRKYNLKKDANGKWIAELGDDESADKFIRKLRRSDTSVGKSYIDDNNDDRDYSAFDQVSYDRASKRLKTRIVYNSLYAYCPASKKLSDKERKAITEIIIDSGEYYKSHILYKLLNNINEKCNVTSKFLQDINYAYTNSNVDKKYWNEAIRTAFANPAFYSGNGENDGTKAKAIVLWLSRSTECSGELSARKHIAEWNESEWPEDANDVVQYVITGEQKDWIEEPEQEEPEQEESEQEEPKDATAEDVIKVIQSKIKQIQSADNRDVLFKNCLSNYAKQSRSKLSSEAYSKLQNAIKYLDKHPEDLNEYDIKLKKIYMGEYQQALKDAKEKDISLDYFNKNYVHNANKQVRVELNKYANDVAKKTGESGTLANGSNKNQKASKDGESAEFKAKEAEAIKDLDKEQLAYYKNIKVGLRDVYNIDNINPEVIANQLKVTKPEDYNKVLDIVGKKLKAEQNKENSGK